MLSSLYSGGGKNSQTKVVISLSLLLIMILSLMSVTISMDHLQAICSSTPYPDLCYNRLAPAILVPPPIRDSNDFYGQLQEVYKLSIEVAVNELLTASNELLKLELRLEKVSSQRKSITALKLCRELLSVNALTNLRHSLAVPVPSPSKDNQSTTPETFEDLKTFLTAAGTYHRTCIDAVDDVSNGDTALRNVVLRVITNSSELTSNSLAILHDFEVYAELTNGMMMSRSNDEAPLVYQSSYDQLTYDAVVAKDGSGNFTTIGDALNAAPSNSEKRFVIYVKEGVYNEIVKVDIDKVNVMMVGDGMGATIVTGNLNAGNGTPTYYSATFTVSGAGFVARDMGFENTAGAAMEQAVALMANADKGIFLRCRIAGYQDTLLAQAYRQLFYDCHVYGTVDFIFGYSAAVFHNCRILARKPLTGQQNVITAQGKYEPMAKSGFSFINCSVAPADGEDLTGVSTFLGRPWKDYSTAVFSYTLMESLIDPKGWVAYSGDTAPDTIFYGEHVNTGAGAKITQRVPWKGLHARLGTSHANKFSVNTFIQGCDWVVGLGIPCT
ncbi:unnamed protein product [Cuscuta europaea]|uniref:Pectinesterase n=1 Tax=Cuscuta europaea TaxID=41803 RepID=A0A9P0ZLH1_CUSEU|nr:unnamed protein product [Cuscuta europaea]CAH9107118.1 unnamed protein product [Cuscuta europaea]